MSKSVKIWLIIAVVFIAVGLAVFAGALFAVDFNFSRLSTEKYETNTYKISENFDNLSINADTVADITFAVSKDDSCRVECFERSKMKHSVIVENGTLKIAVKNTVRWYDHISFFTFHSPNITVFLPEKAYSTLTIDTDTGDIEIPNELNFETLKVTGETADVECYATVSESVNIGLSTGSITLKNSNSETIDISTSTGDIELKDIACNSLNVKSSTGEMELRNVIAEAAITIKSGTGDVEFEKCDANEILVETSTGEVSGTLNSEKVFITDTSTGKVRVPDSTSGGRCKITTSTGDIRIRIE